VHNLMTKLEKPLFMTTDEAQKKYYPNAYVMINCTLARGNIVSGEVVAFAPMKNNGGQLSRLADDLCDAGSYGEVWLEYTQDPLDGGALLVELTYHP